MLRASLLLLAFLATAIPVAIIQTGLLLISKRGSRWFPVYYYRFLARLLKMRVTVTGLPRAAPVLLVGNHVSWLDVIIYGGFRPLRFVAKQEVARWPVFGQLAWVSRTVFIDRDRPYQARDHQNAIVSALAERETVLVFPEGTTSDGTGVFPFKSSVFELAFHEDDIIVQPVSMAYVRLGGEPLTKQRMPLVAYYADMVMMPHLWTYLRKDRGLLEIELRFHEPIVVGETDTRKTLATRAEAAVLRGIEEARGHEEHARTGLPVA